MNNMESEVLTSEPKREGLKYITQSVYRLLKEHDTCTYAFICSQISSTNTETLNRRIYDVLNVMKATKLIDKKNKNYYLLSKSNSVQNKLEEIKKLEDMKKVFKFIVQRNDAANSTNPRLYLPFMVIYADEQSDITCETNEERSFFNFNSNKPLKTIEDLDVLKEIYKRSEKEKNGDKVFEMFSNFLFSKDDNCNTPFF